LNIEQHQKNTKNVEKSIESVQQSFVYFLQVMTLYQENTTKQPIGC